MPEDSHDGMSVAAPLDMVVQYNANEELEMMLIFLAGVGRVLPLLQSHPSRVRGLKYHKFKSMFIYTNVAPLAGAWIEMICASIRF